MRLICQARPDTLQLHPCCVNGPKDVLHQQRSALGMWYQLILTEAAMVSESSLSQRPLCSGLQGYVRSSGVQESFALSHCTKTYQGGPHHCRSVSLVLPKDLGEVCFHSCHLRAIPLMPDEADPLTCGLFVHESGVRGSAPAVGFRGCCKPASNP